MDDKLQTMFNIDPKVASSKELGEVAQQVGQLLKDVKLAQAHALNREAKLELQAKKSAYAPAIPIYKMEYCWQSIVKTLLAYVHENGNITEEEMQTIIKKNRYTSRQNKELVWKCPNCGGELYVESRTYDASHRRYQVTCSNDSCNWTCPTKASTEYDAWAVFEEWLKKNGWYSFEGTSISDEHFNF